MAAMYKSTLILRRMGMVIALSVLALPLRSDPIPVSNEAFLLFLADMVEVDGNLTDALDMQTEPDEQSKEESNEENNAELIEDAETEESDT